MHFAGVLGQGLKSGPVAVEFAVAGVSSTNYFRVFDLYVRRVFPEGPIPSLFANPDPGGAPQAWLNATVLYGHAASLAWRQKGDPTPQDLAATPRRLRGLRYLDSDSYGIAIATAKADRFDVDFLVFDHRSIVEDYQREPTTPARRATLSAPSGGAAQLTTPAFNGGAPFPFSTPI